MIGSLYGGSINAQAQTAAKTLMNFSAAAASVTLLERLYVGQSSFDTSETLAIKVQRASADGTGTAITPEKFHLNSAAYAGIVETNDSAEPTYTGIELISQSFNVLSGFLWTPANDDEVIVLSPSGFGGVRLQVAPSVSMDFHYGFTLREIGG